MAQVFEINGCPNKMLAKLVPFGLSPPFYSLIQRLGYGIWRGRDPAVGRSHSQFTKQTQELEDKLNSTVLVMETCP